MLQQDDAAIVRRLYAAVSEGQLDALDALFAPDYVRHDPDSPSLPVGPAGFRQLIAAYRTAFPDLQVTIDDLIAGDGKVVVRWTARGTHRGEFLSQPPTGAPVSFSGISIYRLAGGRIVEDWVSRDTHGLRRQFAARARPARAAPGRHRLRWYCRFTWYPGTTAQRVRERVVQQHAAGTNRPEQIVDWYNLVGGGAGFLVIETDTPHDLNVILEPYMDLMAWDVHAIARLPYDRVVARLEQDQAHARGEEWRLAEEDLRLVGAEEFGFSTWADNEALDASLFPDPTP